MSRDCPSRSVLRRAFFLQPCGLPRLLRPLLTSGSASSASGFNPQGQISPGKNTILHRTTAAFTSPGPWPQELRSHLPARPGRRRLRCGSCSSAHGLRSTLPPHARSPSRSCASLASLWPAWPGTCTPKIAPMLGAQAKSPRLRASAKSLSGLDLLWLRGQDLNLRPLGYEPNELPGCSTPRQEDHDYSTRKSFIQTH
jgi:hypothetical protein